MTTLKGTTDGWYLRLKRRYPSGILGGCLGRGGMLVLIKSVLEEIMVCCVSLSSIPKCTLEKGRKMKFKFLWDIEKKRNRFHWVLWKRIPTPKKMGGWGIKNIHNFSIILATKGEGYATNNRRYLLALKIIIELVVTKGI